jgi:hypothetical protein
MTMHSIPRNGPFLANFFTFLGDPPKSENLKKGLRFEFFCLELQVDMPI